MNTITAQPKGAQLPSNSAVQTRTMKAVFAPRYGGPDVLELRTTDIREPQDHQIRVQVYAAGVTAAGSFMREGKPLLGRLMLGLFRPKHKIPGTAFSGIVDACVGCVWFFLVITFQLL